MSEGTKRNDNKLFNSLYKITVNDVVEKRNKLTYLSWAWAWAEVSKICEEVDYEIYRDPETHRPYLFDEKTGYMVFTSITVNGVKRDMWLPVMDGANKAMKDEPYTYEVNDYQWNNETKKKEIVGKIEKRVEAATIRGGIIMTTEEVIQMRIRSLQREIDDLERTKAVMVNETARKAIDLHIENLRREIHRLEE
ncbi:hypothetical protein K6D_03670 [Enterococcus faecium]|nr:hypothetical protein K6D_03670 [Enterococcus faecium]